MRFIGDDPATGDADRPLLLLLHGFGSDERDLPGIVPALGDRFDWVSLRAPLPVPQRGFAWVPLGTPPEPDALRAATAGILEWIDAAAPARRIIPVGFSQGGLMVTELLRARPLAFDAGVVLAGFVSPGLQPGDADLAERRPPVFFAWGSADEIIPEWVFTTTSEWLQAETDLTERRYLGLGHSIDRAVLDDLVAFLVRAVPTR